VSLLIVSWNAAEWLRRCLTSLRGLPHEVIVVDNGSTDGSPDLVAHQFPECHLIRETTNLGFAGGVNAAARRASGDFLLLLNSDVEATPGAVDRLAAFLDAHPDCAAVAGLLIDDAGRPQHGWNVRRLPTLLSLATNLLLVDRLWPMNPVRRRALALDIDTSAPLRVEQPAAACLMLRRSVFEQIGGMDEVFYPAWFEDVDLCRRLHEKSAQVWLVPAALFRHRGGVARERLGTRGFAAAWYRNLERYVRKHHGSGALAMIKALVVIGMILRMGVGLLAGDREAIRAHAGVLRGTMTGWRNSRQ
jgi:N-acetylglucosaminyl-diphospho-decaprenol L-rhamnosyltransferase